MPDTYEITKVKYAGEKENPHDTRSPLFKFYVSAKDSQGAVTPECYWQRKSRQLNEGDLFYGHIEDGEYGPRFKTDQRPSQSPSNATQAFSGQDTPGPAFWAAKDRRIARAGIVQAVVSGHPFSSHPPTPGNLEPWLDQVDALADALLARLDQHTPHPNNDPGGGDNGIAASPTASPIASPSGVGSADGGGGTERGTPPGLDPVTPGDTASASPSAAVSASEGLATSLPESRVGFASDKQRTFMRSLLNEAGALAETTETILAYAEEVMERTSISLAIDSLRATPRETGVQLAELAKAWANSQPSVPAPDTTDLAPVGAADDDIPF